MAAQTTLLSRPAAARVRHARATGRHLGDVVRMGLAAAVFGVTVLAVQRDRLSLAERDLFRLFNDLPQALYWPVWAVMQAGNLFGPIVVGLVVAVAFRRRRLGISIAAAGTSAWVVAKLVKDFVQRGRPAEFLGDLLHGPTTAGLGFVSGHAAVAAAMATAAAPYLPRRARRLLWALAWVVGFGRVYTGAHLPLDIVGGVAVGWFVGSLVHAAFGAPHARPSPDAVAGLLRRSGLRALSVEPASVPARSSHPFHVTTVSGRRLFAKVLDPDRRDTDWLVRAARVVLFRDVRDVDALAPLRHQVEHEAAAMLAARAAGVRVPRVVLARATGASAVLVVDEVPGSSLADLPAIGDGLLREVWTQVETLHAHRLAHRDLVRANVLADGDLPWLVDFGNAEQGADDAALANDVAELLASLACVVGAERAVGTARSALGDAALRDALPALEPLALSPATRHELRAHPHLLAALRHAIGDEHAPAPPRVHRPPWWAVAGAAVATFAAFPALAGWTDVWRALGDAGWRWAGLVLVLWVGALACGAGALLASVRRRLALGRTTIAAAGAATAEVVRGPRGRRQYLVAYLRRYGVPPAAAVRGVHELLVVELLGYLLTTAVVLAVFAGTPRHVEALTAGPFVAFAGVAAAAATAGGILRARHARRQVLTPWLRDGVRALRESLRAPRLPLVAVTSAAASYAAVAAGFAASLAAVGAGTGIARPALVALVTTGLLRTLGLAGLPVLEEAALVVGLLAVGVPAVPAVAGVLLFRAVTFWGVAVATVRR
ncbi:MAG TPA: phosphatase PAP2 family protein [Frankiaceae bacterium]|nr:phosphatase PAP2 family protein [Frankiaceae bacterium]